MQKDSHLCRTICGCARVYTAISLDSLGYEVYYRSLFASLGITYGSEVVELYKQVNSRRACWDNYKKDPENRLRWTKKKAEDIRDLVLKVMQDKQKGKEHSTDMAGPRMTKKKTVSVGQKEAGLPQKVCLFCGEKGHVRRSSMTCRQSVNPKSVHYSK